MDMVTLVVAAGRDTAWERWKEFMPKVPAYAETCRRVEPGHPKVSRLSPALRHRLVLDEELVRSLAASPFLPGAELFLQRLSRRRYDKTWLERHPGLWSSWREGCRRAPEALRSDQSARLQALQTGRSGCAAIDYFAQELVELGYLHQKARRWFAAWWVHIEGLPWELGADFFHRHLLDADAATNACAWRAIAAPGEDPAHWISRAELEQSCAPEILGNGSGLDRLAEKRAARSAQRGTAALLSAEHCEDQVPLPARFSGRIGLWLHPDDLLVEHSPLAALTPVAIAGFLPKDIMDRFGYSVSRRAFEAMALEDGMERATAHFMCDAAGGDVAKLADAIAHWASSHRLSRVVALAPFVGEWDEARLEVRAALEAVGVQFQVHRRTNDERLRRAALGDFQSFWDRLVQGLAQGRWIETL